jgi:shikimate dehydrogenase
VSDAYCLFGWPVRHSWSPWIHELFAQQTGQALTYRLHETPPARFRTDVQEFFVTQGGRGCNVTLPHKQAAAALVDQLTPRAKLADAVNTIARRDGVLLGDNTDGVGLVTDLRRNLGLEFTAPRILVLGAGGAARGALGPLLELSPAVLVIANRTAERARRLAEEFAPLGPVQGGGLDAHELAEAYDLVINATSATLDDAVPAVPGSVVSGGTVCYDMAYRVGATPFTRWAQQCGARIVAQGWGMLVEQAAVSFELWRGVRPRTAPVLEALRARAAAAASGRIPP